MQREETAGVVGSLLFHALVGVILFFWVIPEPREIPEFVELAWGTAAEFPARLAGSSGASESSPALSRSDATSSLPVVLPERKTMKDNDVLPVPPHDKLDVAEAPGGRRSEARGTEALRRDRPQSSAAKGQTSGSTEGRGNAGREGEGIGEGPGTTAGSGVSMAMEWTGGGTRRKLSGPLPAYPAGESSDAQIRLEALVTPGGKVRNVRPVQKANARMEDVAIRAVRIWTFEPLPPGVVQKDQTCLITFNFRVR